MRNLAVVCILLSGCLPAHKSRGLSGLRDSGSGWSAPDWQPGASVQTPPSTTYVYSWTSDPRAAQDPAGFIRSKVSTAIRDSQSLSAPPEEAVAGYGIYAAADPYSTASFGNYLVIMPVKPWATFGVLHDDRDGWVNDVHSSTPAFVYQFPSYLRDDQGNYFNYAVVIRSENVIDMDGVKVLGPRPKQCDTSTVPSAPEPSDYLGTLSASLDQGIVTCSLVGGMGDRFYAKTSTPHPNRDSDTALALVYLEAYQAQFFSSGGVDTDPNDAGTQAGCLDGPLCQQEFMDNLIKGFTVSTPLPAANRGPGGSRFADPEASFPLAANLKMANILHLVDSNATASTYQELARDVMRHLRQTSGPQLDALHGHFQLVDWVLQQAATTGMNTWAASN